MRGLAHQFEALQRIAAIAASVRGHELVAAANRQRKLPSRQWAPARAEHPYKVYALRTHTESIMIGNGIMLSGRGATPGRPSMP